MKQYIALAALAAAYSTITVAQTERDLDSHVHGAAALNVAIADSIVFIELKTPWNNIVGFEHMPKTDEERALMEEASHQLYEPEKLFLFDQGNCTLNDLDVEGIMMAGHGDHGEHSDHDDHEEHDEKHDDHDDHAEKHDDHDDHAEKHDDHEEHAEKHDDHDDHAEKHDDHDEHAEKHDDHDEHAEKHDDHDDHAEKHDDHDDHEEHAEKHDDHDDHDDHADEESTHSSALAMYSFECKNIDALKTINVALFDVWSGFEELDVQLLGEKRQTALELTPNSHVIDVSLVQ